MKSIQRLIENPSDPIFFSLFFVFFTFTILFSAKKKSGRRILVVNDVKSDKNHHLNAIKKFAEKYSKVTYLDFSGKLELDLEEEKEKYDKVILLSALRERPEDSQILLYKNLQGAWKEDLMIFYISKGKGFSLPDFKATQVNLEPQDYTDQRIKENLKTLFSTSFLEEFKGTIWTCMALIFVVFIAMRLLPITDASQWKSEIEIVSGKNETKLDIEELTFYGKLHENGLDLTAQGQTLLDQINKIVNIYQRREEFHNQSLKNITRQFEEQKHLTREVQEKLDSVEQNNIKLAQEIQDMKFFRDCVLVILGVMMATFAIFTKILFNKFTKISDKKISMKAAQDISPPECLEATEDVNSEIKLKSDEKDDAPSSLHS